MYPTLAARAIFVAFVQAFGVSTVVRPHTTTSVEATEAVDENGKWKSNTFREQHVSPLSIKVEDISSY